MSKLKPFIAIGIIILIGVIAILFTDPTGDVYNQYLSLDNTSGKGYDSKGKFTKQSSFTGSIRYDETLDDVIEKLCFSLNLTYKKQNSKIVIYN